MVDSKKIMADLKKINEGSSFNCLAFTLFILLMVIGLSININNGAETPEIAVAFTMAGIIQYPFTYIIMGIIRLKRDPYYNNEVSNNDKGYSRYISSEVRSYVWRRDGGKCVMCGSQERLEFDHIIPFSRGGSNTARNIQLVCESCNRRKSNTI